MYLTEKHLQGDQLSHQDEAKQLWRVNWKQHGYPYCGIYTISPDNRWPTKIGISQNPVKRLIQLQNAHWKKLGIFEYCYACDFKAAREVERKTHQILDADEKNLYGEWYDIRPEAAIEVIEFAASLVGVELRNDVPEVIQRAISELIIRASNFKSTSRIKIPRAS